MHPRPPPAIPARTETPRFSANLAACRARIESLLSLRDGWHDGTGKAPTREAAAEASRLLARNPGMAGRYAIFPTDKGGLLFEFSRSGWDHTIAIGPTGMIEIYGTEIAGGNDMETAPLDGPSEGFARQFDLIIGSQE